MNEAGDSVVVSVVIPTYERRASLKRTLDSLNGQDISGRFEVIVVSDGCTDGTDEMLADAGQWDFPLIALSQENAGAGAARNRGIASVNADLIVFLDDDMVAAPSLLSTHLGEQAGRKNTAVIGPMMTPPEAGLSFWVQWEQENLEKQYAAMDRGDWEATSRQFYTGNVSVPTAAVLAVGGFDEALRRDEDTELAWRMGQEGTTFAFCNAAIGYHYAERSFESWCAIARSYGATAVTFGRDRGHDPELVDFGRFFRGRHPIVQVSVIACIDLPIVQKPVLAISRNVARAAHRLGVGSLTSAACSVIQNIGFYQAAADELGGRAALRHAVRRR
jgi:glycosyltransferase involved in cell wall biosynthesis